MSERNFLDFTQKLIPPPPPHCCKDKEFEDWLLSTQMSGRALFRLRSHSLCNLPQIEPSSTTLLVTPVQREMFLKPNFLLSFLKDVNFLLMILTEEIHFLTRAERKEQ